ncbi:MAG: LysM peptidoglycan-binding domain-containing protein [Proteobacteria bacterium]|nr:LysM peptidoglycan-binding domain-containing protein [Pseudomonadota bacterium]
MGSDKGGSEKRRFGGDRQLPGGAGPGPEATPLDEGLKLEDDDISLDRDEPGRSASLGGGIYFKLGVAAVVAAGLVVILLVILSSSSRRPTGPGGAGPGIGSDPVKLSSQMAALAKKVQELKQDVKDIRTDLEQVARDLKKIKPLSGAAGGRVNATALMSRLNRGLDDRLTKIKTRLRRLEKAKTALRLTALNGRLKRLQGRVDRLAKARAGRRPAARSTRAGPKAGQVKRPPAKRTGRSFFDDPSSGRTRLRVHRVEEGETLYRIARKYGVAVTDLRRWNDNIDPTKVRKGMKLKVHLRP